MRSATECCLHSRLHGVGDLRVSSEPVPYAGAGERLLRVTAVGLCGSDLHWFEEGGIGDSRLDRPLVLGHEIAAVIADGPDAGTPVAVDPAIACGHCRFCADGNPNLCAYIRFAGHDGLDGALRQYMTWPAHLLYPVPSSFTAEETAMLEPLGVALHALDLGRPRTGDTAAVFGCGPIGLLVVQLLRLSGTSRIVATDRLAHRREAARKCGADLVLAADEGREAEAILDRTDGFGVDVAVEAAGDQAAVDAAVAGVRPGGRVILSGIPSDDRLTFSAGLTRRKGLTLKLVRRMKHVYPRAIRLLERRLVDLGGLVTHRFPLAEAPAAFRSAVTREGLKVVVNP